MPYKRNYRRKRAYRRRYNKKSSGGYLSTAAKALSVAYSVKKLLNVEHKYNDVTLNNTVGYDAPIYTLLNGVAQGDGATTRDGNSLKMEYVDINLILKNANAADRTVRIMLVEQKDVNGLAPVISEILDDSATQYAPLSHFNRDQINNFRVLYDKRYSMTDSTSDNALRQININHQFRSDATAKVRYDGVLGTVANMSKNSLYLVITADNTAASSPVAVTAKSRVTFLDN